MKNKYFTLLFMMIFPSLASAALDLLSGGYVYRLQIEVAMPSGPSLPLTIQYRSRTAWATNLGFGWCADWTTQLEILGDNRYRLRDCAGDLIFADLASPTGEGERFLSSQGDELRRGQGGLWVFRRNGTRLRFSRHGHLLQRWQNGQVETFAYDGFNRLREWKRAEGTILFSYPGVEREARAFGSLEARPTRLTQRAGNLSRIEAAKITFHFEYDEVNNLTVIREGRREIERIEYHREQDQVKSIYTANNKQSLDVTYRAGASGSPQIQEVRKSRGLERLVYTYQPDGLLQRVRRMLFNEAQSPQRDEQTFFQYGPTSRLRSVTTHSGQKIEIRYDNRGRLQDFLMPREKGDTLAAATALQSALEHLAPLQGDLVL
ncbi:MAG: hypothetical protein AB7N80_01775 [Bdellovibrionales bacterium]